MKRIPLIGIGLFFTPLVVGGLAVLLIEIANAGFAVPSLFFPKWAVPYIWIGLYLLMGISSATVYTVGDSRKETNSALTVYGYQLILNFFWSLWFFNLKDYAFSLVWLVVTMMLIILMLLKFYKISKIAAFLQIPYSVWTLLIVYINLAVFLQGA